MSTTAVSPTLPRRPGSPFTRRHESAAQPGRVKERQRTPVRGHPVLARRVDRRGARREVVLLAGRAGSSLLVDRDEITLADRRLIAHLAADEPPGSAEAACRAYMSDPDAVQCRPVADADLRLAPPAELQALAAQAPSEWVAEGAPALRPLTGPAGEELTLRPLEGCGSVPHLRWCRRADGQECRPCSVREVVGMLQSYEPVRAISAQAVLAFADDRDVSVATLAAELQRLLASRTVLNRGLREHALAAAARGEVSMSEIALRCGRVKRDDRGIVSGETTWLARRLGLVADCAGKAPSPWVHTDVLATIAREGLGVSPREVELG